jgi:hypothetical protein
MAAKQNPSPEAQACLAPLGVLRQAILHIDGIRRTTDQVPGHGEQLAAELRDALGRLAPELVQVMQGLLGPVWGCLPPEIREAANRAGMGN